MIVRPLSQTLNALILVTEETLTRPARYRTMAHDPAFGALAAEIRAADARPAVGKRCTRIAVAVVNVLEEFFAGDLDPRSRLLCCLGALLPDLRDQAWTAIGQEKAEQQETRR